MTRTICTLLVTIVLFVGCSREIGDSCETSVDCDVQNKRICDLTQPGGYCTIRGCEKGTCPEEAVCVLFRPEPERLALSWCMYACDDNDDCRDDYSCLAAEELGDIRTGYTIDDDAGVDPEDLSQTAPLARNLDKKSARFCTVKPVRED
jgi:hypothetical protein